MPTYTVRNDKADEKLLAAFMKQHNLKAATKAYKMAVVQLPVLTQAHDHLKNDYEELEQKYHDLLSTVKASKGAMTKLMKIINKKVKP